MVSVDASTSEVLRLRIKHWTRSAWKASGKAQHILSELMGQESAWLGLRISAATNVVLSQDHLSTLSRLTRHALTPEVIEARAELDSRRTKARFALAQLSPLPVECGTAEAEMAYLIELAHEHIVGGTADRNAEFMRQRFGVGTGQAATLAEVGGRFGLTRERVRQVEAKMLARLADAAETLATPKLDEVVARARSSVGLPIGAVEDELRASLGRVPLQEALRFQQEIRPGDEELGSENAQVYGQQRVRVLAGSPEETRLAQVVSMGARKLVSFAGACLVSDLRAYVEDTHVKAPMSAADIVRLAEALPGMAWLAGEKRWFWFPSEELTPLLLRAAIIIGLAQTPVDIETLYAGLVRETRRGRDTDVSGYCDPIPPSWIVQAMLDAHPLFRRRLARSHGLAKAFDPYAHLQGFHRALAERLEAHGGVLARVDLEDLPRDEGSVWSKDSLSAALYLSGFIERVGSSLHALRGRNLTEQARKAALDRAAAVDAERGRLPRPSLEGDSVVVHVLITQALKRNRNIYFRRGDIPGGIAGQYVLQDGGKCQLVDDVHGIRLTGVGNGVSRAIKNGACGQFLRFAFVVESRYLEWSLVDELVELAISSS